MDQTPAPAASRRGNPFGIASLIAGVVLLLVMMLMQSLTPGIPYFLAEFMLSTRLVPLLLAGPPAIVAVIATVLGIVGLLARDRSRVAAIIGTTLGASHLVVGVVAIIGAQIVAVILG